MIDVVRPRRLPADGALLAIAAAGLVLRILYTATVGQKVALGISDASFYSGGANALADGQGYIDIWRTLQTGEALPTAHHPPGWPALLAAFSLAGVDTELGHRLVGCLVGGGVIFVIGLLGQRIGGRAVGLIAAGLAALHPTLVAADGSLMSETLAGLFVLIIVLAGLRVADRPSSASAAALGAAIGAGALIRGELLLYSVLIVVPVAAHVARRSRTAWRELVRIAGLAALGTTVMLVPWTARNHVQLDGLVLISTNESTVLAGANCDPAFRGPGLGGWHLSCVSGEVEPITEVEQAAVWRREGITYARDNFERLPIVAGARVMRTWGLYQPFPPVAEGRDEGVQTAGTAVWLAGLLPLAVVGTVLIARQRRRIELPVMLAPIGAAAIVSIVGFGMLRFRHSMELMAIVFAAVSLQAGASRLSRRSGDRRAGAMTKGDDLTTEHGKN